MNRSSLLSVDEREVNLRNTSQDTPNGDRIAREAYVVPAREVPISMSVNPKSKAALSSFATISPAEPGGFLGDAELEEKANRFIENRCPCSR